MTLVDILAAINQAGLLLNTLAPIASQMTAEGRTQATPEEIAKVRAVAIASEERLDAATR
jgi:hypothetical protein